jgi:hypothetical protein
MADSQCRVEFVFGTAADAGLVGCGWFREDGVPMDYCHHSCGLQAEGQPVQIVNVPNLTPRQALSLYTVTSGPLKMQSAKNHGSSGQDLAQLLQEMTGIPVLLHDATEDQDSPSSLGMPATDGDATPNPPHAE